MMIGDVTVIGMDVQTVVFGDIGMDVPPKTVVTVPADRATLSKDLWRAISQRRLFQLHAGPVSPNPVRPMVAPTLAAGQDVWQVKCRTLEQENAQLRERIAVLEQEQMVRVEAPSQPDTKLDQILELLQRGIPVSGFDHSTRLSLEPRADVRTQPRSEVVDIETPTFIPSEIRPKNVEGRVQEIQTTTAENQTLGTAASALRKFRKGSTQ